MEETGANCHISSQSLNFNYMEQKRDSNKNLPQVNNFTLNNNKKETSKKWGNTIQHSKTKTSYDYNNTFTNNKPLDLSNYKTSGKKSEQVLMKNGKLSESSTFESTKNLNQNMNSSITNKGGNNNLYDSLLYNLEERKNSSDTLVSDFNNQLMVNDIVKTSLEQAVDRSSNFNHTIRDSNLSELKTVDNPFIDDRGESGLLKEGDYIYDDCIRIIKFLSEGAQGRVYIGMIEEIDKLVAVKRITISYDESLIDKIQQECETVKSLEHANIIKYFDIEIVSNTETTCSVDIIMEYSEGLNLKDYLTHYCQSTNSNYLPVEKVKIISRKILEGLAYLHQNKIIHRDLKPENVIVNEDLSEIKIVDFGICTKVIASETFKQRSLLGTPYYMAPEVILEKPYAFEADVWSLGCIIYELVSGVKPYSDMNPFNAMLKMAQYTSPLEYADESIQDIFYDKQNRQLLDFLQKCWRPNNMFRPSSTELLDHKFIN